MNASAEPKSKTKMVAIDPDVHSLISTLAALLNARRANGAPKISLKDLLDSAGWNLIRDHRTCLEPALARRIEIPEPNQLLLPVAA